MAAAAERESETQLCSNCKKDIPVANFTIHEIHCSRNIGVCHFCQESVPKSEMKNHVELQHTQVACKCKRKMERGDLPEHLASACPLRPVVCQHCELELAFNKLKEHVDYCGARTEQCVRCHRNVMLKDLKEHPEDCGKKAEEDQISLPEPCLNSETSLQNVQMIRNILRLEGSSGPLPRANRLPESRLYNCLSGQQHTKNLPGRSIDLSQPDENQDYLEKTTSPLVFVGREPDCHFDYLLALSLQRDSALHGCSTAELQRQFWKNIGPTRTQATGNFREASDYSIFSQDMGSVNLSNKPKTVGTLLPCEFCEELYPEEDLILHQTGCSPASALASFSKSSASLPQQGQAKCLTDLWAQQQRSQSSDRERFPLQPNAGDSIMLPCEFCGVQLEEEILFHHQDQCDARPASSTGGSPPQPEAPATGDSERTEPRGLPRRRVRPQGEISSQCTEEITQQRPPQPVGRSLYWGNPAAARHVQLNSPNNWRETEIGPLERGQGKNQAAGGTGEGAQQCWGPSARVAEVQGRVPARRPAHNFPHSSYVPSFPVTGPTRPRLRREGSTTPPGLPRAAAAAKPWQTEATYPDKED